MSVNDPRGLLAMISGCELRTVISLVNREQSACIDIRRSHLSSLKALCASKYAWLVNRQFPFSRFVSCSRLCLKYCVAPLTSYARRALEN